MSAEMVGESNVNKVNEDFEKNEKQSSPDPVDSKEPQDICEKSEWQEILDHLQNSSAIFRSQQIDDPELTGDDKRQIAEELYRKSPLNFLMKFGSFLKECHLDYFDSINDNSYELRHCIKTLKLSLNNNSKRVLTRNRRFEALKRLEVEGTYFSDTEMEQRDPLLYDQLVGQFLSEKEKLLKCKQKNSDLIPTFSSFLIDKMDQDDLDERKMCQQKEEDYLNQDSSSEEEIEEESVPKRWGDDWIDAENAELRKHVKKPKRKKKLNLSPKEKELLLEEFKTLMHTKFLDGMDADFDYSKVDSNPEYDCLQVRSQDEEEKYFDEETCDDAICTDTGIEDY